MNNGYRALIRVLLTAGAFLVLPQISVLGFAFHGSFLSALCLALIFEVTLWVAVVSYSIGATALGFHPQELPAVLNAAAFMTYAVGFLKLAGLTSPGLLTLPGILPALAGAFVLLIISGTSLLRRKSDCGCSHDKDDDSEDDSSGDSK